MPAERRRMILDLLREPGSIHVADVEERFPVSPMTARRAVETAYLGDPSGAGVRMRQAAGVAVVSV